MRTLQSGLRILSILHATRGRREVECTAGATLAHRQTRIVALAPKRIGGRMVRVARLATGAAMKRVMVLLVVVHTMSRRSS